jgi:hypothetical protein
MFPFQNPLTPMHTDAGLFHVFITLEPSDLSLPLLRVIRSLDTCLQFKTFQSTLQCLFSVSDQIVIMSIFKHTQDLIWFYVQAGHLRERRR